MSLDNQHCLNRPILISLQPNEFNQGCNTIHLQLTYKNASEVLILQKDMSTTFQAVFLYV